MPVPYITHLLKDKKMLSVITQKEPFKLELRPNVYIRLCGSIMSQQLSTKVAAVIFKRFLALYGGMEPTAEDILNTPLETLRAIGLSNAKTRYVHNVARFEVEQGMGASKLGKMSNEEVIEYLTPNKGSRPMDR